MKRITASIDGLGIPTLTTSGFVGTACLEATAAVEKLYGGTEVRAESSEMYATETEAQTVEAG